MISVSEIFDFIQLKNTGLLLETFALAHPEFGSSVNPISTKGADYAHQITASPPQFENPAASLKRIPSLHADNCQQDKLWKMKI